MRQEQPGPAMLQTGHYLGLKFQDGWWFVHVLENEFIELKPWILLNENGVRDTIAAGTAGSEDDEIVDTVQRDYIVPQDEEQNLIWQIQYGIDPSRMQVFPIWGRDRAPNLRATAEPGEPQIPVDGFDSPYNNPSKQTEFFTVNDMEQPSLQAFNPMDEAKEAKLSFHVNKMKYATIEDMDLMAAFIQGQVKGFRAAPMGLGAQNRDQLRVPAWLRDAFGDVIFTTEQILEHAAQSQGGLTSNIPQAGQTEATQGGR